MTQRLVPVVLLFSREPVVPPAPEVPALLLGELGLAGEAPPIELEESLEGEVLLAPPDAPGLIVPEAPLVSLELDPLGLVPMDPLDVLAPPGALLLMPGPLLDDDDEGLLLSPLLLDEGLLLEGLLLMLPLLLDEGLLLMLPLLLDEGLLLMLLPLVPLLDGLLLSLAPDGAVVVVVVVEPDVPLLDIDLSLDDAPLVPGVVVVVVVLCAYAPPAIPMAARRTARVSFLMD